MLKVYAHMATMPGREQAVRDAVESIRHQVTRVYVNRNPGEYSEPFESYENVTVRTMQRDYGDAAKFASLGNAIDSLAFVCDDDLIYPPDIIERLRANLDGYSVIGVHGRKFLSVPVISYYRDRSIRHRGLDSSPGGVVDVIATCAVLFRNNFADESHFTLECAPLEIDGRNSMNMGDIHFSKWMRAFGREMYVIPHSAGWIRHSAAVDLDKTIWAAAHKNDAVQTELVNGMLR